MADFPAVLADLEELIAELERLDDPVRERMLKLLDAVDAVHRLPLQRLSEVLEPEAVESLREADPAIAWLLDAYGVGVDERSQAEAALESIRPYIHSHGGAVEVMEAAGGVVRVRLSGSCSGCTASATTLQEGVARALEEGLPGFVSLEVEEDAAASHPPPGPTLLEIENRLG